VLLNVAKFVKLTVKHTITLIYFGIFPVFWYFAGI